MMQHKHKPAQSEPRPEMASTDQGLTEAQITNTFASDEAVATYLAGLTSKQAADLRQAIERTASDIPEPVRKTLVRLLGFVEGEAQANEQKLRAAVLPSAGNLAVAYALMDQIDQLDSLNQSLLSQSDA